MSATQKFTYANGREAKLGDTIVNQNTGAKFVIAGQHLSGDGKLLKFFLHSEDHHAMPRSTVARLTRAFQ